jgi:hypothetical protein
MSWRTAEYPGTKVWTTCKRMVSIVIYLLGVGRGTHSANLLDL